MTAIHRGRIRRILWHRLREDVFGLPIVWVGFLVVVALIATVVGLVRGSPPTTSTWETAAEFSRWYVGAVGVYLTAVYLPLYVAHGSTRRQFAIQLPPLMAAFAVGYGFLMTLGYGVETLLYRGFGWVQDLTSPHFFNAPSEFGLVFLEFALVGVAWVVAGAVLGGAFYRDTLFGIVLVPVMLAVVAMVEAAAGTSYFGPLPAFALDWLPLVGGVIENPTPAAGVALTVGVAAAGLLAVWAIVRDLPVRTTAS